MAIERVLDIEFNSVVDIEFNSVFISDHSKALLLMWLILVNVHFLVVF